MVGFLWFLFFFYFSSPDLLSPRILIPLFLLLFQNSKCLLPTPAPLPPTVYEPYWTQKGLLSDHKSSILVVHDAEPFNRQKAHLQ